MFDSTLRPVKDAALSPFAAGPASRLHPLTVSVAGLGVSLAAAVAAWRGAVVLSVALWLLGRLLDGFDGTLARATGRQSDLGGLLDFLFDTVGYLAVPLGLALAVDDRTTWITTAVVLATFYLNAVSLGQVAAVLEKRARGAAASGAPTSTVLPRGLVEGTETIVFFTIALAVPSLAWLVWSAMAVAVVATVVERTWWIRHHLRAGAAKPPAAGSPLRVEASALEVTR